MQNAQISRMAVSLGKLVRVPISVLPIVMICTLIFGGFYASIHILRVNLNPPLATCSGAFHNYPTCKPRKALSNYIGKSNLPSLTIFTAPTRPFSNSSHDPQYQALLSWLSLVPTPQIVLLGRDPSFYKISKQLCDEVSVEPNIDYNLWGTSQVHSIFARAQQAHTHISMVIDAGTLLFQDAMDALQKTHEDYRDWVILGKTRDLDPGAFAVSFTNTGPPGLVEIASKFAGLPTDCKQIADHVMSQGSPQGPVSFWAWNNDDKKTKSINHLLSTPIPPFSNVMGTFESWVLQHLIKEAHSTMVIDASEAITSVRFASNSFPPVSTSREEAEKNSSTAIEKTQINSSTVLSTSREEAQINVKLSMDGNVGSYLTSMAPWKLIQCAEPKIHNLCMVEQKKREPSTNMSDGDSGQLLEFNKVGIDGALKKAEPHILDTLLPLLANENKVVIMVGGTSNYKEMLLSFICRAQSLGIQNVLVAAFDEALYEYAYMQGLPVYLESSSQEYKASIRSDGLCIFASECFKHVTKLKSMSVLRVLKKGYSVLWSDMDIAWFENPLPHLLAFGPGTLVIQSDEPNQNLPENNILGANSGFYLAQAEEKTIRAFEAIVAHAMESDKTEQPSFYNILCGEKGERRVADRECVVEENGLRTVFLSHEEFPNGYVYRHWEKPNAYKSCKKKGCVLLHNNFIAGKDNKLRRFVEHGLWFYDVDNRMCIQPWHPLNPTHMSPSTFQAHFLSALNIT